MIKETPLQLLHYKKIIPSNSRNLNENTIIKNYIPDSGITNIFVNNTNISVPYLCCDIKKIKSKPRLKKQNAIENFEKLKSIVDLIGKVSYYENKDEIIYFNNDFYFILEIRHNNKHNSKGTKENK